MKKFHKVKNFQKVEKFPKKLKNFQKSYEFPKKLYISKKLKNFL